MAIHVRSTRRAYRLWRELRVKLARLAVIVALLAVLIGGTTLYLIRIFNPPPPSASFIAWQEPADGQEKTEQQEARSSASVKPLQMSVTPVIVSVAEAVPLPETIDIEFDDSEEMVADVSVDLGADLGEGVGADKGNGGSGRGGSGSGRGKGQGKDGAMGYNDDVQVVLVLDASGSMDRLFQAVSNSMEELLRTLGDCTINGQQASVNVGIVVYGQSMDDGKPFQLTPFTVELEELRSRVQSVNCDGWCENCGEAIAFAVKNYPWNKRSRRQLLKVIFIAGNESFDQGPVNYRDAMADVRKQGIIVNTIHCGEPNSEWSAAARLGEGEGLTFAMNEAESVAVSPRVPRSELMASLYRMPVYPLGTPAEQQAVRDAVAARPPFPNPADGRAVHNWARQHLDALLRGCRADAVELCRLLGGISCVDDLGGRGNLPPELRQMDDAQIVATVSEMARERQNIIDRLRRQDNSSFIEKLLETLIKQAAIRGISITR